MLCEMMRNTKNTWKTSSQSWGPWRDVLSDTEKLCLVPGLARRRETISVLDSTRGKQGSQVSRMLEGRSKSCIIKYGATCVNLKTEVLHYFRTGTRKVPGRMGGKKTIRSLWKRSRKLEFFSVCVP
ncbi:CFF_collapsed_G0013850.mRNA.1.CDS.1 [Saccharomyces cerevisiae]|nr:CFF_collapsed_G0013850.mRNA.1.CDS.1 [Saccharomyces cerevisiae]